MQVHWSRIAVVSLLTIGGCAGDGRGPNITPPTTAVAPAPIAAAATGPFAGLSFADRDRLYNQMSYMGARAAGLWSQHDVDALNALGPYGFGPRPRGGETPYVIGGVDSEINGLTEAATQSETSIAINSAGTILIGGYNDAAGFPSDPTQKTLSLSGVARSSDGGASWAPVLVGPNGLGVLPTVTNGSVFGDPDVKYDPTRDLFFYASIYVRPSDGLQGMSISVSNSGTSAGTTWSAPREVSPSFATNHSADKELIDVNTNTGRILLGWTDFTSANTFIKTTFSDDGGTTWSAAATIDTANTTQFVQASIPRFLPGVSNAASNVYIVWRDGSTSGAGTRNIGCARSSDGGATWSPPVDLDSASYTVEDQILGVDRIATSPSMAIDYATGKVYVVYQRNDTSGTGDVALRTFTGNCAAAAPVILDANPGSDRAQFMPWVTVDQSNGFVHVIWYDQGHDATGDVTEVMHTVSKDHGATWSPPTPLVDRPFHAGFGNDTGQPNMGDYIQATAQSGKLHTLWGGTAVEPQFNEGQPSGSMISPDTYYDVRLDTDAIVPLRATATTFTEASCKTLGNGNIDPGETISVTTTLSNYVNNSAVGAATITGISGTLSTSTTGVTVTTPTATWADLAPLATGGNTTPMQFQVSSSFVAGTPIDFILTLTTNQGTTQLPIRTFTGTPGSPTAIINEDFEGVTPPALPTGWTAVAGAPAGATDLWVTSASFTPMTTKFAFHGEGTTTEWMRLLSPVVAVPTTPVSAYVSLDFDVAYRLEDEPTQLVAAYDGAFVRLTDQTMGATLRSILAEAFAEQFTTGSANHYPKHLPRSSNTSYFQDMSAWSGDSNGVRHVSMRFPASGMAGRSVQLRFEYTQDSTGTCATNGYQTPCGIALDNVKLQYVPVTDAHCATADLSITKSASPSPVFTNGTLTYTLGVANAGPSAATSVTVTDTLPGGVTFVSASGTGWTCGRVASVVTCTMPSLAATASSTISIVVTAPASPTTITNTASISADQFDPAAANNTASAMTSVVATPVCGNGSVESGEQCDDGAANGTAGDCCSATCTFLSTSTVCRPATGACDVAEMCNGAGVCPPDGKAADGTPCLDSTVCNGSESCLSGVCTAGTPLDCNDNNICTTDSCDPTLGCQHTGSCPDMTTPPDLSTPPDLATAAGDLSMTATGDLATGNPGDDLGVVQAPDLGKGGGQPSGCGCTVGGAPRPTPPLAFAFVGLFGFVAVRRRRAARHR